LRNNIDTFMSNWIFINSFRLSNFRISIFITPLRFYINSSQFRIIMLDKSIKNNIIAIIQTYNFLPQQFQFINIEVVQL